jgi:DNA polymerase III epsilon subunit-like protein
MPLLEIFLDIESTGPDPCHDRIFQLAAIASVHKKQVGAPFSAFVNPEVPISPIARKITGKSMEDVKNAASISQVLELFFTWINSIRSNSAQTCVFIAHSGARFDFLILWNEMNRAGFDLENTMQSIGWTYIFDTYLWMKKFAPKTKLVLIRGRPSLSLSNLYLALCKEKLENAHDALVDTRALFNICQALPTLFFSTNECYNAYQFLSNKRFYTSLSSHNFTYLPSSALVSKS